MCGIVGFTGSAQAAPILLDGLSRLEYRGYDSAGMAVQNAAGKIEVVKAKGRLRVLSEMTDGGNAVKGCCGIGHTRWATHGEPSVVNAHPHYSRDQKIAVVHNGIIENYQELKDRLASRGFAFASQTDTEVVAQLLDYYYTGVSAGDCLDAITRMMLHVRGSYALGVLFADQPGVVYAVRKDSPLIVGKADNGNLIASDVPALLKYTRTVYYIDNMEIARLTGDSIEFFNVDKEPVTKESTTIEWDAEAAEKGGYEHFMMKEIHEQPTAVRDTISPRIKEGRIDLSELSLDEQAIRSVRRLYIIGCGSAYHVGVAARYVFERLARLPVEVDVASEFRYRDPVLEPDSLAVIISQSGETADSLAALRECRERGVRTIGIVNVVGSSIAREADATLYTWAGPEIAVATTKAYSTQLAACYLLAVEFARVRGQIDEERYAALVAELQALPDKIGKTLEDKERIQWFASKYSSAKDAFFIGRGLDYAVALEGSLKFKEISYIHSEAFAAGEMKHGPISLVEKNMLVVGVLTQPDLYEKMVSNLVEAKSRGAFIMGLTTYGNYNVEDTANFTVYVPKTDPLFATSLSVIPLQLLAYYVSCAKGLDVDKPRNLAKSVTVE
ncbi:glutamine--fructose-6-phosphate transaminase (isomerizing) [bacterium]|uniref:glutamine--fructose-6-phosphate transaminase (isomerizing) n=1 Tax=Gemmiger sp. TaxID=2049027 RepID=UPI002A916AB0|nr:glutamine--fructose-6-phosphate transaminase (isomerizing) [Gemmiger sp.]MCI5556561.1 glutamine--fructose-6-phosphate transaminase (isomerizing) [bacterium]MCI6084560.1 glutamine--fructose-6-phosphate transaminase (isomerizing) [bacterium]MCI6520773.1 glutamine--fructose-6-phosphate transaminase (isomerizing) [bacterium]MCI7192762.1 glutamine--fructose-6-phosphate transaminase (isomerizing) [bacterium]MCI7793560.1 glutamine--fructose-6-phosphate transaminase (isomerizing) [bacterium]